MMAETRDTMRIHYFDEGSRAHWVCRTGDGPARAYSANRSATFHLLDLQGAQIHGAATTPIGSKDVVKYFRQVYRAPIDLHLVASLAELQRLAAAY
jgi:hypothetical protein